MLSRNSALPRAARRAKWPYTWNFGVYLNCSAAFDAGAAAARRYTPSPVRRKLGPSRRRSAMLQASLGLEFDHDANEIRLRQLHLPPFINDLTIKGLRLGGASIDLALHGQGKDISMRVLPSNGDVRVSAVYT